VRQAPGSERLFTYYPEDFGDLPVRVIHMDLVFDVYDGHTRVVSALTAETLDKSLASLELNARDLDILRVGCDEYDLVHTYDRDAAILTITFASPVPPKTQFVITTETICRPSRHLLEGLYYDGFRYGGPPNQITQCQQWGFQRLVPCLDDMTAKCTYSTTIVADEGYTNLISNGDVAGPRLYLGMGRSCIHYSNTATPMAPYLFFLGVGVYDTFRHEVEYPDGKTFLLEMLVKPGSDAAAVQRALEVLADAVIWVYLFSGPGQYSNRVAREELWRLVRKRDALKASESSPENLREVRETLAERVKAITPGYRYTGAVYREIAMENSDFGGMENVGNTTIAANRIMPFPQLTDPAFEYMIRIKVHEYYHNLNGSEVTGRSPFEIWLNEAVTVHIEHQHHAFFFGEAYSRLQTVLELNNPENGTLALDCGAGSMPIEPDGFNDPNDLITGVTYVKAPEFVRMVEMLMGREAFAEALDLYHTRFRHKNASREDWIRCMEEVSGQDLSRMAATWLKETEYPVLTVTPTYDPKARQLSLALHQQRSPNGRTWEFPFRFALVGGDGKEFFEQTVRVTAADEVITVRDTDQPAFLSLNRGYSFYGKMIYEPPGDELYLQARKDSDLVSRFTAFQRLVERQMRCLLADLESAPAKSFVDLIVALLADDTLMDEVGGAFLTIFPSVDDERFAHHYRELHDARRRILAAAASRHRETLLSLYSQADEPVMGELPYLEREIEAIRRRLRKNVCLEILASLDTDEVHRLIAGQFGESDAATDRLAAFRLYLESSAPDRLAVLEAFEAESSGHPVSWEAFLAAVSGSDSKDLVALLRRIESSDAFQVEQANQQRALFGRFALNRKQSLENEEGRAYLTEVLLKLAPVNEYSTVQALDAFAFIDRMEERYHLPVVKILADLLESLDPKRNPSVYNTARRLLLGAPVALQAYEDEHGAIEALEAFRT
jgi:aminopeptidase N